MFEPSGFTCDDCGTLYPISQTGQPDFRLRQEKVFRINKTLSSDQKKSDLNLAPLEIKDSPEVDYRGMKVPLHLTRELLSYFPAAKSSSSLVLDLGCGDQTHKSVCEKAGFCYVGLDLGNSEASILGDAHALPFADESFEFVLSISTFEHLEMPHMAVNEVARVLVKGGTFIGSIAFMEPFHANSYFHMSHLGVISILHQGNFEIERIAPSKEWSVLFVQARMALFPRMPIQIVRTLIMPVYLLHRLWWAIGRILGKGPGEQHRVLSTTGNFTFIATKPEVEANDIRHNTNTIN